MSKFTEEENGKVKKPKGHINLPMKFQLSDEDKAEIEAEVEREILNEVRKKEKQLYKKQLLESHRRALDPGNFDFEEIVIDVAGHADRIIVDGKHYFQGCAYTVSSNVAMTINDIMWRTHQHEAEVGFANRDQYRPPRSKPKQMLVTPTYSKGMSLAGATF